MQLTAFFYNAALGAAGQPKWSSGSCPGELGHEFPHVLGPSQREQAPSEVALAYAEVASPSAPRQLLELHLAQTIQAKAALSERKASQ